MRHPRSKLDDLLLHPVRFSILALLHHVANADFAFVRDEVEVSDSVLSKQVSSLEEAGYLLVQKRFVGKRPKTSLSLSEAGRSAFAGHLDTLRAIVEDDPAGAVEQPPEADAAV